ncbi:hypothetical protein D3C85_1605250 [compost metagenome]
MRKDQRVPALDDLGALPGGAAAPGGEGGCGGVGGQRGIGGMAVRHAGDDLAGGRVGHGQPLAGAGIGPFLADEVLRTQQVRLSEGIKHGCGDGG